jgi:hypothetical protein
MEATMKALAVIVFVLMVLAHPAAAAAVLGAELAACVVLGWLAWRALRPMRTVPAWRSTS